MDGKSPSTTDWINSVKKQAEISKFEGAVKWSPDKKNFKIKKVDQNGKPVKGVTFSAYNSKTDVKNETKSIGSAVSDDKGDVIFKDVPLYYQFYIKETKVPDGYTKSDEIIPVYRDNGVRFLGEMNLTNLNSNIKGGTEKNSLSDKGTKNLNTYLQSLVSAGYPFNNNTNWLVYNDNGVEKLASKKPLKYAVTWNSLYNAGVVFGEDGIRDLDTQEKRNSIFTIKKSEHEYSDVYNSIKEGNKPDGNVYEYKPQYVSINGKTYIVRLMRTYNESIGINDNHNWKYMDKNHINATKGSEWNKLILPLINPDGDDNETGYNNGTNGRYGSWSKDFVESNMPTLANYSWWKDFGGNSTCSGNYDKGNKCGIYRWTQETGSDGVQNRTNRAHSYAGGGGAYAGHNSPFSNNGLFGWFVVLEEVKK